jgi:signal transduction histidine kinase
MSGSPRWLFELVKPAWLLVSADLPPVATGPLSGRDRILDALGCAAAVVLGALFLSPALHDGAVPLPVTQIVVDVSCGALACGLLWWRRRWPLAVAVTCVVLGMFSISATPAGLLAIFSLAVLRPARRALLIVALWVPAAVVFAVYSPTTDPLSVVLVTAPFALTATAWGMFIRARRQLLLSLRERAFRAESDQRLHEDRARTAERSRIAREMHDVLGHRISLLALQAGALEVSPDLPAAKIREVAELLGSTARQALEELRGVIGLLRTEPGPEATAVALPTLSDIHRLVEETRLAGATIDFEMRVEEVSSAPSSLGRDAYRVVQEALTNIGKHATGAATRVRITGAPARGLQVSVRNLKPLRKKTGATLPGSGSGLLGLQERVDLAGGTLLHGPDGTGGFVVDAELQW